MSCLTIDDIIVDPSTCWDPYKWIETYKGHEKNAKENGRQLWCDEDMSRDRLQAAAVTRYVSKGNAITQKDMDGSIIEIPPCDLSECSAKFFKHEYAEVLELRRHFPETKVRIVNADVIDLVHAIIDRSERNGVERKVIALNMANQFRPGGGFVHGRIAQEEALCFRTALHSQLDPKEYEGPTGFGDFTASLQLNVPVLRKGIDNGFAFLKPEERWKINILSMAGYDRHKLPKEDQKRPLSPEQYAGLHTKINAILMAAAHAGADVLVLGALGCGVFANPPEQVSTAFANVLHRFAGVFERVYFAILANPTDRKLEAFQNNLIGKPVDDPETYYQMTDIEEVEDSRSGVYEPTSEELNLPSGRILTPCPHMAECDDFSDEHRSAFEHHPYKPWPAPSDGTETKH